MPAGSLRDEGSDLGYPSYKPVNVQKEESHAWLNGMLICEQACIFNGCPGCGEE